MTSPAAAELDRFIEEQVECIPLPVGAGESRLNLRLLRVGRARDEAERAVLIVHGANSGSMTFLIPGGGLAGFLAERGWDVWLLDWRGGPYVVEPLLEENGPRFGSVIGEARLFSLDNAADDVFHGVQRVRQKIGDKPLSLLGHCVGGGITSIAIALGLLEPFDLKAIMLTTLGLFYEAPWDGWIKAEDFVLERVLANGNSAPRAIDPHSQAHWPDEMYAMYKRWPKSWLVPPGTKNEKLLNHLSFMVGRPWSPECIDPRIDWQVLKRVFGPLHMGLYLHCGQMIRRGYAAPFDAPDIIDRSRPTRLPKHHRFQDYLRPEYFRNERIELISGAQNRLWHRDSIDLMYEWLLGEAGRTTRVSKHVFPDYGLQEIFWDKKARDVAYPELERRLKAQD